MPGRSSGKWNGSCEQSEESVYLQWQNWLELVLSYLLPFQNFTAVVYISSWNSSGGKKFLFLSAGLKCITKAESVSDFNHPAVCLRIQEFCLEEV